MNLSALRRTSLLLCRLALAGLLSFGCVAARAQAASADYTNDMPSVQKVETQIQGTDPLDTAARQVAVFEYLQTYIQRIKLNRDYKGPYTPGETKLLTDYAKAQYDLTQNFTKTHTPDEVKTFNQKEGQYSLNNALGWIKQLEGQQAADTYKGTEAGLAQSYQQHEQQMQQQMKQEQGGGGGLLDGLLGGDSGGGPLDAKQKRCLELGGSYNECAGALMGMVNAMGSLLTLGASTSPEGPPSLNGVILVGAYHSRTDLPEIGLDWNGQANLQKCGTLVDAAHTYTLRKSGGTLQVVVDNEPDAIVLTQRADGSLAGPGSIQVKGQIITGYHNEYVCTKGNCTTSSTPIYGPSMQHCTLSLLAPQPPPPPPKPVQQGGLIGGLMDELGADGPTLPTIYGFRVTGDYASSNGMLLSFSNSFVTLDCGQAHINAPYAVDNAASGFVVRVQNGGGAFQLGVAPDNTLRGSGSTTVNGKLVSGVNGKVVSFTPHSESCNVGTFAPKGKQNTMLASNAPMPAVPAYSTPVPAPSSAPAPARTSSAPAPASPAASPAASNAIQASTAAAAAPVWAASVGPQSVKLAISTSFPAGPNPLAGHAVMLMSDRFDSALRKSGGPVPEGTSPGKALAAYAANCLAPKSCPSITPTLNKFYVGRAMFDSTGKVVMDATVSPGTYYVFSSGNSSSGVLVWDLPIEVKASGNAITLQNSNAEVVK